MAFQDVRRLQQARGAANERAMQEALSQPGAIAIPGGVALGATPGSHGDVSDKFYDDPTVNALVKLPSQRQAEQYTGTSPSFYGIQRPGDWQRVVQRLMAADALPGGQGELARMEEARRRRAAFGNVQ